jgi:hypothetical protein
VVALSVAALGLLASGLYASVYPPGVTAKDTTRLLQATAFVRSLDEGGLRKLVPAQSGLYFVGCPNCNGGRQEGQLAWSAERPDEVYCRYCSHRYASTKYPMDKSVTVHNPRGETQQYPYWADSSGYRYFFQARRDDLVREYLAAAARDLALLFTITRDAAYARRSAVLLDRFAEVFPGWCYHYDYPFQQKVIYDGDVKPAGYRTNYRTARWTWWAYMDVPTELVQAYDWIRDSGAVDAAMAGRIERDLLRNAGEQVYANVDDYTNMSPSAWTSLVRLGRVIGEPRYVHEPVRRLKRFVETQFFYDMAWHEGAPSYHAQTLGGLSNVLGVLRGYSDAAGYTDPVDGGRFDDVDLEKSYPALGMSNAAFLKMRFPDGREVPVHDTWSTDKRAALAETKPWLLPALGHACLGGGAGKLQQQFHLTWGGGYGHQHGDSLSLLGFAFGREMLSDLGYSHTRYRSWTLATVAHNTVAIDGLSQNFGSASAPSDGVLRFYDGWDGGVQVVSAAAERAFPKTAKVYRRTLAAIDNLYVVDVFEVEGGTVHDYFLHGDADADSSVEAPLAFAPLATLLPAGFDWQPTRNEGEASRAQNQWYAYGFLRNLRSAAAGSDPLPVTFRMADPDGPGLRATLLPEPGSQLVLGANPSIRRAGEDDTKVDTFVRPFLMLRHEGGRSVFAAVIEPFAGGPAIAAVERLDVAGATLAIRIRRGSRTEVVVYGAPGSVGVPAGSREAIFAGDFGVLSMDGESVLRAYAIGEGGWTIREVRVASSVRRGALTAVRADGRLVVATDAPAPAAGSVIRLLTEDCWAYPFTVEAAAGGADGPLMLTVAEGPGMEWDAAGKLRLTAYPQREHRGAVTVEWHAPGRYQSSSLVAGRRGPKR